MKSERIGLVAANLSLIAALGLLLFAMNGCMTYKRAVKKFAHVATDSARITVPVSLTVPVAVPVPADSVALVLKTDSSTVATVVQDGRARLTFRRNPTTTSVRADCLPDTIKTTHVISTTVVANCPPVASFGVAPWYKTGFLILSGLLVALLIVYLFTYQFKISRR